MILSLCMPYFRNPMMLGRQLTVWRDEWPAELKRDIEIILVDDGSPDETAAEVLAAGRPDDLPALSLYRITENRLWHQHAARNLAAHVARGRWLLMTDMDHVIPAETLGEVLRRLPLMGDHEVLTFGRVDAPRGATWRSEQFGEFSRTRSTDGSLKPHPNSFVLSRERYWLLGGYEEDLTGIYGTDKHFRDRLYGSGATPHHLMYAPLIRVDRQVIADADTRGVERKTPGRLTQKRKALARKAAEGRTGTTTLAFPWEKVL